MADKLYHVIGTSAIGTTWIVSTKPTTKTKALAMAKVLNYIIQPQDHNKYTIQTRAIDNEIPM